MTAKNKGGRPRAEVDYNTLNALCKIQCTGEECAAVLGMNYDTLNAALKREGKGGFSDYIKEFSRSGKASLRRLQFKAAELGNVTMLIWLGKQHLGQSDKHDLNHGGQPDNPVKISHDISPEAATDAYKDLLG